MNLTADDNSDKNTVFGLSDLTRVEAPLPDWVVVGESVLVRPYSYSGVIVYVGPTEFAPGIWIGVELDAPTGMNMKDNSLILTRYLKFNKYILQTVLSLSLSLILYTHCYTGKNDGAVNGRRYFTCRPKCGIFVKVDKLIQDRRGRALRSYTKQESAPTPSTSMRRSVSKGNYFFTYLAVDYFEYITIIIISFFLLGEGLHSLHRSRSRGEGLSTTGTRSFPRGK